MLRKTPSFVAVALIPLVCGPVGRAQDGFRAQTIDSSVAIGYGVAIGDVDGDGRPDLFIGSPDADPHGPSVDETGEAYVLFSRDGFAPAPLRLGQAFS